MPIEIYNLPYTLHRAEMAQAMQTLFASADRAAQESYKTSTVNQALQDQLQVTRMEHAEGSIVNGEKEPDGGTSGGGGERRGAEPEEDASDAPQQPKEPSPDGKGNIVDLKA